MNEYLKKETVRRRINEFETQNQIKIQTLLMEVLVEEKDMSFGELISKLYPSAFLSKDSRMNNMLANIGSEKYMSLYKEQRKKLI